MITELQTLRRNAKNYFNKLGVTSWSNDYTFSYTGDKMLEIKIAYGSALHNWIRSKEEYDTESVMDIFGFKNDDHHSWEWVDTNTITLYKF